jgi:hypothetical protein
LITFIQPPAPGAEVSVSYKRDLALSSVFHLGDGILPHTIKPSINGIESQEWRFDAGHRTLVFASPPPEGSKVTVNFARSNGPKLLYDVIAPPFAAKSIAAVYSDGTKVSTKLNRSANWDSQPKATLEILDPAAFRNGETLWLHLWDADNETPSFELPSLPLPGSLILTSSSSHCPIKSGESTAEGIEATGSRISVKCSKRIGLVVHYKYETMTEPTRSFDVSSLALPIKTQWRVSIDGGVPLTSKDFYIEDSQLMINDQVQLEATSVIVISAISESI